MILLEAVGDRRFWISDNPIVMFNSLPYGNIGLSAPGIEIYFPLSPSRALAFFCPSIGKQIAESLDPEHPRRHVEDPIYPEMLRAIRNRSMLAVPDSYVEFLNELQVRQSTRFLYSDRNEFDLARRVDCRAQAGAHCPELPGRRISWILDVAMRSSSRDLRCYRLSGEKMRRGFGQAGNMSIQAIFPVEKPS